ncbi:hypothetical protein EMCRGX_G025422 [Ephydatia muelleri]
MTDFSPTSTTPNSTLPWNFSRARLTRFHTKMLTRATKNFLTFGYYTMGYDANPKTDPLAQLIGITAIPSKATVISYSAVVSFAVFGLSYIVSFNSATYRSLKTKEKVFWCLAFARALFGVFCTFASCWYIFVDPTLFEDVILASTLSSHFIVDVVVGFFIFECIAFFSSNIIFREFDMALAAHHLLSLFGYGIVVYSEKTHFFSTISILDEMTTPFSCVCWILIKAKLADTYVWKINQIILVHLFHCRTLLEGYLFLMSYRQWDNVITNMPWFNFIVLYVFLTLQLFILTPYWTYKKTKQLFKPEDWNHSEEKKKK